MDKGKDTRRLQVIDSKVPWMKKIVIQHDLGPLIRKTFGIQESEKEKIQVIPFEPRK